MAATTDNFLPEDYLERRAQRRTNLISLTLFVLVMGGVVGAFFITDRQRQEVQALQRQVDAQYEDAARRLEQLDELQKRKQRMIRKARITAQLLERVPRSILLAELINNMPASLSLVEFELASKVITLPPPPGQTAMDRAKEQAKEKSLAKELGDEVEVKPVEVSLMLVGVAPTDVQVAQFMTALGKTSLFTDVSLVFSEESKVQDAAMRKFRVEMRLNGEIDTRAFEPKMVKRELKQNPMADKAVITPEGALTPVGPVIPPARTAEAPLAD